MRISLIVIGKTDQHELKVLIDSYLNRLGHYCKFDYIEIPDVSKRKKLGNEEQKKLEAEKIEHSLVKHSKLILLDEKGQEHTSRTFSQFIEKLGVDGNSSLAFVIGGPYGFDDQLKKQAFAKISLSKMTYTHQMARLIFAEQLYRAFSILKGEPYHHD